MAIIYTYPVKGTPLAADLLLISDTADGNKSKNATIASLVTSNAIDVVDTLNSLKGDVSITGGANITVTPSGQNIEISTSSNLDGSGTAGKIPKWSDSNTLTDSVINENNSNIGIGITSPLEKLDVVGNIKTSGQIFIPGNIIHIGDTNTTFGFPSNDKFLVNTGSGSDQFSITPSQTLIKTDSTIKFIGSDSGITLYHIRESTVTNFSDIKLETDPDGIKIKGKNTTNQPGALADSGGTVKLYSSGNNKYVGIQGPLANDGSDYVLRVPKNVGTAGQVLKLPSTIGSTPYQLAWGDAGSGSGTGGFETLPFTTANGYITGETSLGTYVFQMIAPSNCEAENFKFYHLAAQSVGRTTTVAIYKGVIGDGTAPGELHSAGQIGGVLGAAQISGSTLTVVDGATAISAGDNIVVCFSIDQDIQPLGVIPITANGGIALTNASPVSNSKLAIHDSTVALTAAQIQASATTITALEALLTSSAATTSRPFLLIY